MTLATRRSFLYVPGDRPDRMPRAVDSGAHALILDLEDGVAPSAKDAARREVAAVLAARWGGDGPAFLVRVDPDAGRADIEVAVHGGADGIVLAKATSVTLAATVALLDELESADDAPRMPVTALVESARGLLDAVEMAESSRVEGLAIGEADLRAQLGVDAGPDEAEMAPFRAALVVASAAAGRRRPTAPASVVFRDLEAFRVSCERLRRQGFGARSAIHPDQVRIIHEVFAPSEADLERARATVEEFDRSVAAGQAIRIGDDGTMMDEAVVRAARRLLDGH